MNWWCFHSFALRVGEGVGRSSRQAGERPRQRQASGRDTAANERVAPPYLEAALDGVLAHGLVLARAVGAALGDGGAAAQGTHDAVVVTGDGAGDGGVALSLVLDPGLADGVGVGDLRQKMRGRGSTWGVRGMLGA